MASPSSSKTNLAFLRKKTTAAARWQSKSVAGKLKQPPFRMMDLMARYQSDWNLMIGANVNNLFDKVYMSGMRDFGRVQ
jgi:outer membrane receptor for ferric coprogen and ferric-rhodotorulic acid